MLSSVFETRAGRTQEFFKLLYFLAHIIIGPTVIMSHRTLDNGHEAHQQAAIAALAIFLEALVESFIQFIVTIRFYYLWRNRHIARSYSRRLRGIDFPNFIIPTYQTGTGPELIHRCTYFGIGLLAGFIAALVSTPAIVFDIVSVRSEGDEALLSTSLFLLITIGTGGNILAGLMFVLERLSHVNVIAFEYARIRIILPILYVLWFIFSVTEIICRIWVHSSSDPALRALAKVFLFRVTTDSFVTSNEGNSGKISGGKMYISLREEFGVANVSVSTTPCPRDVSLGNIYKLA